MSTAPTASLDLHDRLLAAHRAKAAAEYEFTTLLAEVAEGRHYAELGYASIVDYAAAFYGLNGRQTVDRLRLARAMPQMPALDAAVREGRLEWTKGRELLRVITPETAPTWVERAEGLTSRALERLVSVSMRGEEPPEHLPEGPARYRVVFEMEASDAEALRALIAKIRAEAGANGIEVDDSAALATITRQAMAMTTPITAEPYRTVLHKCPNCEATTCGDHLVSDTVAAEAACDTELVDLSEGPNRGHLTRTIAPSRRRAVFARDRERCVVPGCSSRRWLHLHHVRARSQGGSHAEINLATLCSLHHRLLHDGRLALERLPDRAGGPSMRMAGSRSVRPNRAPDREHGAGRSGGAASHAVTSPLACSSRVRSSRTSRGAALRGSVLRREPGGQRGRMLPRWGRPSSRRAPGRRRDDATGLVSTEGQRRVRSLRSQRSLREIGARRCSQRP